MTAAELANLMNLLRRILDTLQRMERTLDAIEKNR